MNKKRPVFALLLVGGLGTRLWPPTKVTNKHLLPMGAMINRVKHRLADVGKRVGAVMLDWPIRLILQNQVQTILVVTGGEHMTSVSRYLASGVHYPFVPPGCPNPDFFTRTQDDALGIADAILQWEGMILDEDAVVLVVLGDNVVLGDHIDDVVMNTIVEDFIRERDGRGARVFTCRVKDWQKFGIAQLDAQGNVVRIVEKPKEFIGDDAITGIYAFGARELFAKIHRLKLSDRGELEISHANQLFLEEGALDLKRIEGHWLDMGDSQETYERSFFILDKMSKGMSYVQACAIYDQA